MQPLATLKRGKESVAITKHTPCDLFFQKTKRKKKSVSIWTGQYYPLCIQTRKLMISFFIIFKSDDHSFWQLDPVVWSKQNYSRWHHYEWCLSLANASSLVTFTQMTQVDQRVINTFLSYHRCPHNFDQSRISGLTSKARLFLIKPH